jgi:hypothetical protein
MEGTQFSKRDVRRLEIGGLFTLSFLAYIIHMVIHNMMTHGMNPQMLAETAEMMNQPSMKIMMLVWSIVTVAPAFLAFVLRGKNGWRVITVLAVIVMALNGIHSILHIAQGDLFNGGSTFILQMVPGVWALVWSFGILKMFKKE